MLIGIAGKANTGKDTIGELIKKICKDSYNFQIKKFADKVYDITSLLTGYSKETLMDRKFKENLEAPTPFWYFINEYNYKFPYLQFRGSDVVKDMKLVKPKIREILQDVGTTIFRAYNPYIWIDLLLGLYVLGIDDWIITDVRFDNEAAAIRKLGGLVIKIESDRAIPSEHISEAGISDDYVTHTITNNKETTLKELEEQLWKILKK